MGDMLCVKKTIKMCNIYCSESINSFPIFEELRNILLTIFQLTQLQLHEYLKKALISLHQP